MRQRLAIIGGGPKAAAIAARAAVLRDMLGEASVPEILVLERERVGAAWDGHGTFSSGFVTLCTPGEKDVGFPYDDTEPRVGTGTQPVGPDLFADFSWQAFLVALGRYGDWVDRDQGNPNHALFAEYLRWVFAEADQEVIVGTVQRVWAVNGKWCVDYVVGGTKQEAVVDGVVLSGAGRSRTVAIDPTIPAGKVFDAETFWPARHLLAASDRVEVAVAGDGGAAGAIAAWLLDRFAESSARLWSISPMGTLFPRGDGHAERRWFTRPQGWGALSVEHRRKLIERTEAGVISMRNKRVIDASERVNYLGGKLVSVDAYPDDQLRLGVEYAGRGVDYVIADYLVNAIGFDPWSRLELVDHPAAIALTAKSSGGATQLAAQRDAAELDIGVDLAMPASAGFPLGLHVPGLAGLAQGPGMGNLSCLGLVAARILDRYLT